MSKISASPSGNLISRQMIAFGVKTQYAIDTTGLVKDNAGNLVFPVVKNGRPYLYYNDPKRNTPRPRTTRRLDYLVAENFLPRPSDAVRLIHIDGNELNCDVRNLKWITKRDINAYYVQEYGIDAIDAYDEIWKSVDAPTKEPIEVSSHGRVRLANSGQIVDTFESMGYRVIYYISKDDPSRKTRILPIHRLVAKAFLPNPNNYTIVNHLDGNKQNNHVDNLEWSNLSMNTEHGNLINDDVPSRIATTKLEKVAELLEAGLPHVDISNITGVDRKVISDIYRGRRHPELSKRYHFREKRWSKDIALRIVDEINKGHKGKDVLVSLGLGTDQAAISFYERVRREYRDQINH